MTAEAPRYRLPDLANHDAPHVMGILNITPDSFSDGGEHDTKETALAHAKRMIAEGADILDIGAESTRPGSTPVSLEDEWARIDPVLDDLVALGCPLSLDTYKAEIARRGCARGIAIINDIWGLQGDPDMARVAAEAGAFVIMMHNRETVDPDIDIMSDIKAFFERSIAIADQAGIPREKQILDPGFGFGKTMDQNFQLLNRFEELMVHNLPVLSAASRKRMIDAVLHRPKDDRIFGSVAVHLLSIQKGAAMVRAHDVKAHSDAARIFSAMKKESVE